MAVLELNRQVAKNGKEIKIIFRHPVEKRDPSVSRRAGG
jgi:hypothetical protein